MKNKNNIKSKTKRMNDLYAKFQERELFRAAVKSGKLEFVVVDGKASK
jgi:hypothetical protein